MSNDSVSEVSNSVEYVTYIVTLDGVPTLATTTLHQATEHALKYMNKIMLMDSGYNSYISKMSDFNYVIIGRCKNLIVSYDAVRYRIDIHEVQHVQ